MDADERARLRALLASTGGVFDADGLTFYCANDEDSELHARIRDALPALLDAIDAAERLAARWEQEASLLAVKVKYDPALVGARDALDSNAAALRRALSGDR